MSQLIPEPGELLTNWATASAQTSGGAICATVSDPSGALVPRASITIEEISTGEKWRFVSSSASLYNAPNLPAGRYNPTRKVSGFSTAERTNIDVQVEPGNSEEKVTVGSQTETVDLASSQTGVVNSGEVVRELPRNGRNWTTLAALQPEVSIIRTEFAPLLTTEVELAVPASVAYKKSRDAGGLRLFQKRTKTHAH